jgi:uncharacterized membrane protein
VTLAAAEGPTLVTFFGRFHPATVHFPIALVSLAAILELLRTLLRKPGLHPATFTLAAAAAVSAGLSTLMGLANADGRSKADDVLEAHRWAGVATAVLAVVAMLLVYKARSDASGTMVLLARGSLVLGAILVGLTGHWGGVLVHGEDYYSSALPRWLGGDPSPPPEDPPGRRGVLPQTGTLDFVRDIAPIVQNSCFSCHGGDKSGKNGKGGLKLSTKALAMKGGDGGPSILPGKPQESSFYTLLIEKDVKRRMPEKAKPLPQKQILLVRRWIEEGATWPDGYEFRK